MASLDSLLMIFTMIGIGVILAKRGILNKATNKVFSKIVVGYALPMMMVVSIPSRFTKDMLLESSGGILIAFLSVGLTYIIAKIVCILIRIEPRKRGLFCTMMTFANAIFIGLPMNVSLLGEDSVPFVFLFYMANTTLFWTIGVMGIRQSGNKDEKISGVATLKKLFSPPLVGFLIGAALVISGIKLPYFIEKSFTYMGNLTTPIAMLFIGTVISSIDFKKIKLDKYALGILIGRFLIAPAVMYIVLSFVELPKLLETVFQIESCMPIVTQSALVSEYYDANAEYAAFMVAFSTLLTLFIVPIYTLIFI